MSDTVKVVIEIPKEEYEYIKALSDVVIDPNTYSFLVKNGIPLDDVKAEIEQLRLHKAEFLTNDNKVCIDSQTVLDILDNIGKERKAVRNE